MLKSVKGHVVYLPLPFEEHAAMMPNELPPDHELQIIVNGQPTKSKVIWQDLVRIDKVKLALQELIHINP